MLIDDLFNAIQNDNITQVKNILNRNPDIINALKPYTDPDQVRDGNGNTALHFAVVRGRVNIVEELLNRAAGIDAHNAHNQSPLFVAAAFNQAECARTLIRRGANIEFRVRPNDFNATPLHIATEYQNMDMVRLLLEYGANPSAVERRGNNALALAANTQNLELINLFRPDAARITELQSQIEVRTNELANATTEVNRLQEQNTQLTARVTELENAIAIRTNELANATTEVDRLQEQNIQLTARVTELTSTPHARPSRFGGLFSNNRTPENTGEKLSSRTSNAGGMRAHGNIPVNANASVGVSASVDLSADSKNDFSDSHHNQATNNTSYNFIGFSVHK